MSPKSTSRGSACTLLAASLVLAALLGGCEAESSAKNGPMGPPPAVVTIAPVTQGEFDVASRFVGRLGARLTAELYARTDGPIVAVYAGAGDRVSKGQLLAQIDPSEAQQRVRQADAALRMAQATLQQRQAGLQVADANAKRSETLAAQKLLSESDYDVKKAELVTAQSQLELARAQIEQAKANLSAANLELDKTKVIAPFDGYIGTRHLDQGAYATTNRSVFSIVDLSLIRTTIAIPGKDAVHIKVGQTATVTADVLPGKKFNGAVARMSSVFDPQTDTVEAEVDVPNPDAELRPGMFASVAIAYRTDPSAILVPTSAVERNEHEEWLYVAEKVDGENGPALVARRLTIRALESADPAQTHVAVEPLVGTLEPGMNVIVLGQNGLADGAPVVTQAAKAKKEAAS